jgi:hypothetical protein
MYFCGDVREKMGDDTMVSNYSNPDKPESCAVLGDETGEEM